MQDIQTVKIASVAVKTSPDDAPKKWVKYILTDGNGREASTFDAKLGKFLQDHAGQLVDIVTKTSGDKGQFTDLVSAIPHVETAKPAESGKSGGYYRDPETEQRIAREACLKAAVNLHGPAASGERHEKAVAEVLRIANTFLGWVNTGLTPELEALVTAPAAIAATPKPVAAPAPNAPRALLIRDVVRGFNADPVGSKAFLADKGWSLSVADLTDQQLRAVAEHMAGVAV